MTRHKTAAVGISLLLLIGVALVGAPDADARAPTPDDPLVLAHYYIWFDPTSWNRAKKDIPLVGRYSSDDEAVMSRHVAMAQQAGIDGFIVSWKSSERLDARLDTLVRVAEEADFGLAVTYQGLDFNRDPLPLAQVGDDLDLFTERWSRRPPFRLFERPLVVWTGTWEHDPAAIGSVTEPRRDELLILASEKSVEGYERLADVVDGNLYYWSSVDPGSHPKYPTKLVEMGNAVRSHGQIWIAPAAPGFDAQLVGGDREVLRHGGRTLRDSFNGALSSVPDAIGLISWNEFSENTHVEPSQSHGDEALRELARLTGSEAPVIGDFDSSAPQGVVSRSSGARRLVVLATLVALVVASVIVVWRRQRGEMPNGDLRT